jgi:F-type H+-transporting ATPase subunit b
MANPAFIQRLAPATLALASTVLAVIPALAAPEAANGAEHHEPFYATAEFFVAIAFVLFVIGMLYLKVHKMAATALDSRATAIRAELDEAQRLREEAQHTLAEYQRKQRDALQEAEAILAEAREEAGRIEAAAAQRTEATLKRREQQALDMIAAAEATALSEVRNTAVDIAIDATRRLLTDTVNGERGDAMIDAAIRDLPGKLH